MSEPQVAAPRKPVSVTGSRAVLGTLGCPGGCHVAKRLGSVKIGGRKFKLAVKLPADIAAGASAPLRVVLPKPVLKSLATGRTGTVTISVTVIDASGRAGSRTVRVKIRNRG